MILHTLEDKRARTEARRIAAGRRRHPAMSVVAFVLAVSTAGCGNNLPGAGKAADAVLRQSEFRVRSDVNAPLNDDTGWAGAAGEDVTVFADQPFRIRLELEHEGVVDSDAAFRLQVRRNGEGWLNVPAADFPYPDEIASPRVSIVSTPAYKSGAATNDLLPGSRLPFRAGSGVLLDSLTDAWSLARSHGEWEWPVVIRRFADSAVINEHGDVFEFRMADAAGRTIDAGPAAKVTLAVPSRLLGGTFVETPGRLGPWQAEKGDLYFVMEPAETWNVLMMVKSNDGGASWREADGANRPATDDLEGFATTLHRERVHMLHQTSNEVHYHVFRTADHPTAPDTWEVRDELVTRPGKPPTQVADIAVRADGSVIAVYGDPDGLRYRIRTNNGGWGNEVKLDGDSLSGPQVVVGRDDVIHLAYSGSDGHGGRAVYTRRIETDGTLTPAVRIADGIGTRPNERGAVLPLVFLPTTDCVAIIYRIANGELWERRMCGNDAPSAAVRVTDRPVVQSAVDSHQVGADAIAIDNEVHVLFIDEQTRDIHHTRSAAPGQWTPPTRVVADINAQWIRGARIQSGNDIAYGFIYDAGSDGGSGMNRYGEVSIRPR
jgi:hypothetical protein